MPSIRVPCVLMRGGTSRGPFFLSSDLPTDVELRDAILLSALGAGHELQVDGIGGGNPLTSKVAIVGPSTRPGAQVDYMFAQVKVSERVVDTSPNCGNMLSAVVPFAIEQGLIAATPGTTTARVHNVNTGKLIDVTVSTPGGRVTYEGDAVIDGVPGSAAPILMTFLDVAGAKTGRLLPTGQAQDEIDGLPVSCVDAGMPLVILRAADLGKTALETPADLDRDRPFMDRLNAIRIEAGRRMGLGDVSGLVIPKPVILSPFAAETPALAARYFMPHSCHKAFAVTGGIGLAMAAATPGTVAAEAIGAQSPASLSIRHPAGRLDLRIEQSPGDTPRISVLRTARRLFEGAVFARIDQDEGARAAA
ncbi:4-oxalomesaconate tautomerase [Azorhizobium caulinodans]|uniref:4-oxalomesaconate tautomerase n=1 Tax=Azorhizobium caulinodans TaxID=7 RepID=UPI002FBD3642